MSSDSVNPQLAQSVEQWDDADWKEVFRRIGIELEEGPANSLAEAAYGVARGIVGDAERAGALGDDINNADTFHNMIHDYDAGPLVWMSWARSRTGSADGIRVLDFGTGKHCVFYPPNLDDGRSDWDLIDVISQDDREAKRTIILDYLSWGWLPDSLSIDDCVTREEVHDAYTRALDAGLNGDWESLVMLMEGEVDGIIAIGTPEHRHALLDAYLSWAIET